MVHVQQNAITAHKFSLLGHKKVRI